MVRRVAISVLAGAVWLVTGAEMLWVQQNGRGRRLEGAEAFVYKHAGRDLKLYVFQRTENAGGDPRPAIVFFHGGGWRGGNPTQFVAQCRYLASRGMVAITVEYRLGSTDDAKVADCVADAKSAMRWVRAHAEEMNIDPTRIAAGGGSAGGHLAAAVATLPEFDDPHDDTSVSCRPNAALLFNPALDLTAAGFEVEADNPRIAQLHGRLGGKPEALSPLWHVSAETAPTIIFHGIDDRTVPFSQAEDFADAMEQAEIHCELNGYDGAGHGFFNYGRGDDRAFVETMRQADEFLADLGWLEGEPTID